MNQKQFKSEEAYNQYLADESSKLLLKIVEFIDKIDEADVRARMTAAVMDNILSEVRLIGFTKLGILDAVRWKINKGEWCGKRVVGSIEDLFKQLGIPIPIDDSGDVKA